MDLIEKLHSEMKEAESQYKKLIKECFLPTKLNVTLIYISFMVGIPFFPALILAFLNEKNRRQFPFESLFVFNDWVD